MAQIAVANSDLAILTSDNPRMEDPEAILEDMKAGLDPSASYLGRYQPPRGDSGRP